MGTIALSGRDAGLRIRDGAVTEEMIRAYEEDGVVCLRGGFGMEWVELLRRSADEVKAAPGPYAVKYENAAEEGSFFGESFLWVRNAGFRAFIHDAPAAGIAGRIMRARKANMLLDHLFIKEPGTSIPVPFHQDYTYFPVTGSQYCSIWLSLDHVTQDSGAVDWLRGSHRWGKQFRPADFKKTGRYHNPDLPEVPDIDADRAAYDIVSFETEPGDCIVFHGLTLHGSPGNSSGRRRRALATRWTGDDVAYKARPGVVIPPIDPRLRDGDPLDSEMYPVLWRA